MTTKTATTFWRIAGMSYLQYINKATSTVRSALKEPAKQKAMQKEVFGFNKAVWEGGVQGPKVPVP
eukprot:CAMPEP_0116558610 /NCGR_PEP_ID=MMETSP0397-20121206/9902_1 /TAXON_ID=216820 /ORGANISM="Cyclophora tenuis, Strain ECT3854" /LENGTH=65 /DNA_ID=CAMNT_0004084219 /DNA_START=24 /DNA_END=221 /DNA_ORIENTATION=-